MELIKIINILLNLEQSLMYLLAAILIPLSFMLYMNIKEKLSGKKLKRRRNKRK